MDKKMMELSQQAKIEACFISGGKGEA